MAQRHTGPRRTGTTQGNLLLSTVSSGLPPQKAPVMIAEKLKLFFGFLSTITYIGV